MNSEDTYILKIAEVSDSNPVRAYNLSMKENNEHFDEEFRNDDFESREKLSPGTERRQEGNSVPMTREECLYV